MKGLKVFWEKLPQGLRGDKRLALIVGLCVLGVLLLVLSALPGGKQDTDNTAQAAPQISSYDVSDYVTRLEERLCALLGEIDGAGKARVMLTLESGTQEVYAGDERQKTSSSAQGASSENDFEYITIKAKDGSEQGLLLTIVQPRVRGVAVVCEGGGSALVQAAVIQAVTAVLDVSAARVSVSKMG
ncbi:MAG: hypothetical protein LBQ80_05850 [Clostridium sp.]|jgi:stage III sporulation protein AG|nr:hypothetical protein [Clostridium sp.]